MMPTNKREKKNLKQYNLRIKPETYDQLQEIAKQNDIPMNTQLQYIITDFLAKIGGKSEQEEEIATKIKSLPLKKRQALVDKLINGLTTGD